MFSALSDRFSAVFRNISGRGKITESNVREALEQVRTALLEADVHYEVVQQFTDEVLQAALGTKVIESLRPGQQMIKIVYDRLVRLMGPPEGQAEEPALLLVEPGPTVVMMCGLQGSGKTTTCGKLAVYLRKRNKTVCLAAADLQRPAAVEQLRVLAEQVNEQFGAQGGGVHFYAEPDKVAEYGKAVGAAVAVARNAVAFARKNKCDVVILDTAGRLHVNDALMGELRQINAAVNPQQILLTIDAMTGQDAVNSAKAFNDQLELDGVILSKFDSDARGGAALSVRRVTGKPIKFIGVGEKLEALEEFHAARVASRILGMGDVVSLVEKAQEQVTAEEAAALQAKMAAGKMTMDDFLNQLRSLRKMGPLKSILGMLPGIGHQLKDVDLDDRQLDQTEAIIRSMTPQERREVEILNNSRRRRIAKGSGTSVEDVSQLVKGFETVSKLSKQMSSLSMMGRLKAMAGLGKMDLSSLATGKNLPRLAPGTSGGSKPRFKQRKRKSR